MIMIDATLIIHAVGHVKVIVDTVSYARLVDGVNTVIYLLQQVLTVAWSIGKSKKAVIFFQMVLAAQQMIQCLQPLATETVVIDVDIHS
jgi:hypothetical protein